MSATETDRLRIALNRLRRGPGRRTRYPISIRHEVAIHARRRLASGEPLTSIARSLGLALASLQRWAGTAGASPLRRVRFSETPQGGPGRTAAGGVLITPGGYRIEGLEVEQLAALLRSLS
jgi:hypothetical protein